MKWSELSLRERVESMKRTYENTLTDIDSDGTALTHETYTLDRDRYFFAKHIDSVITALNRVLEDTQ